MANEADLPQFSAGPMTPIGQVAGMPVAHKKQASGLMKRIMAHAKPAPKLKPKGKFKSSVGKPGRRGIESDNKVHFGKTVRFY